MGDLSEADRQQKAATSGKNSVYLGQKKVRAKVVVSCAGILVEPNYWPADIPGREAFKGVIIHIARWRYSVGFQDEDVIVAGTGLKRPSM